jgi:hypothetical protein
MTRRLASALMVLALAGCGSSSGSPTTGFEQFVGTWTISDGMLMADCRPVIPVPISTTLMGDQTVQRGTDSDLVFNVQPKCKLLLDVNGNTATARPMQACIVTANGAEVPGTVNSGMLMVNGESAKFAVDGDAMLGGGTCTFNASGSSMRTAGP